jgi:flagellin-like protein
LSGRHTGLAGYSGFSIKKKIFAKRRRKSGISEILGSLLMIVIVVGLSAIIFAYATNSFSGMGSSLSNLFGNSGNALAERVVVEQVTFNESGAHLGVNLYVRNDGVNPTIISAVYVNNITASKAVTSSTLSKQINSGSFVIIAITFTPDVGTTYGFTIATQLGNTVVVNAKA